jgi:hypothetical protein
VRGRPDGVELVGGEGEGEGENEEEEEGGSSREGRIREDIVVTPIRSVSGSGVEFVVWDINGIAVSMQASM